MNCTLIPRTFGETYKMTTTTNTYNELIKILTKIDEEARNIACTGPRERLIRLVLQAASIVDEMGVIIVVGIDNDDGKNSGTAEQLMECAISSIPTVRNLNCSAIAA